MRGLSTARAHPSDRDASPPCLPRSRHVAIAAESERQVSAAFQVGDAVRTERAAPSRGNWPRFRNRPGFVVSVNEGGGPNGEPEYGVILTTTRPSWRPDAPGQLSYDSDAVLWFAPSEIRARGEA